jgi:hypothetical protein
MDRQFALVAWLESREWPRVVFQDTGKVKRKVEWASKVDKGFVFVFVCSSQGRCGITGDCRINRWNNKGKLNLSLTYTEAGRKGTLKVLIHNFMSTWEETRLKKMFN